MTTIMENRVKRLELIVDKLLSRTNLEVCTACGGEGEHEAYDYEGNRYMEPCYKCDGKLFTED